MLDFAKVQMNQAIDVLKAAGEATRLRLLVLLAQGDLTVTELTEILGQSQPRISRHLKLLADAGLIERYQEGAWAYFRLISDARETAIIAPTLRAISEDDKTLQHDLERLSEIKSSRASKAQKYFSLNAEQWEQIRRHHVPEERVESELCKIVGPEKFDSLLDLGTGTGRILELFEGQYRRGLGINASRDMLAIARNNLDVAGISHASVRQGDIFNLSLERESFDLVIVHQVLHFLHDPAPAIKEAVKMLAPSGRLVVIDFAPHDLEYLRDEFAHARLGFSQDAISSWMEANGLEVETVSHLNPNENNDQKLTVSIWLGRDPRLLIAGSDPSKMA